MTLSLEAPKTSVLLNPQPEIARNDPSLSPYFALTDTILQYHDLRLEHATPAQLLPVTESIIKNADTLAAQILPQNPTHPLYETTVNKRTPKVEDTLRLAQAIDITNDAVVTANFLASIEAISSDVDRRFLSMAAESYLQDSRPTRIFLMHYLEHLNKASRQGIHCETQFGIVDSMLQYDIGERPQAAERERHYSQGNENIGTAALQIAQKAVEKMIN